MKEMQAFFYIEGGKLYPSLNSDEENKYRFFTLVRNIAAKLIRFFIIFIYFSKDKVSYKEALSIEIIPCIL